MTHPATISDDVRRDNAPPRRAVAPVATYTEAQRVVDYLADKKCPVDRIAIAAEGRRLVERVTGRLTWGNAALNGAVGGR
jgi:hypothetical protein